jgi:serine/threonine protein phosphatase 1
MRTLVIGDIHGTFRALLQCLERSGFDRAVDRLVVLGDVCDVYPDTRACIDELLALPRCEMVIGNHDLMTLDWALRGHGTSVWLEQGGAATLESYAGGPMPVAHTDFLNRAHSWLELEGRVFVHGGFDPALPLKNQSVRTLAWDRSLLLEAAAASSAGEGGRIGSYREIFVGHTPTQRFGSDVPVRFLNIWDMDTGAGWRGRLSIMDVETRQVWQSDPVTVLYSGGGVRKGDKA